MITNEFVNLFGAIIAAINTGFLLYFAWKKLKPEVKKIDAEVGSEIVDAANLNLEGAKVSALMLLDRINELRKELDEEKKNRKEEQEQNEKSRREDVEYFRRRIKDLERESRDYRSWAAKLAKQVVEAGQIPAPFIPSTNDSETNLYSIRTDLEEKLSETKPKK